MFTHNSKTYSCLRYMSCMFGKTFCCQKESFKDKDKDASGGNTLAKRFNKTGL